MTRYEDKMVGTQITKVHVAHKVVNPKLKTETHIKHEGIPKPIPVLTKLVTQPKMIDPPIQPRKEQGRVTRKNTRCKPQPIPQPQLINTPTSAVLSVQHPLTPAPPTPLPPLGGGPSPRQPRYELPVYKDPILAPPPLNHLICL